MTKEEEQEKLEEGVGKARQMILDSGANDYGAGILAMGYREGWQDRARLEAEESE